MYFMFFVIAFWPHPALAADEAVNDIEFRLILSPDELSGKSFDTLQTGSKRIHIWKMRHLSDTDIEQVEIFRSTSSANLMACFKFNEQGRKRLYRLTKRFQNRWMAIFTQGKLLTILPISIPVFMGERVIVNWSGTEPELQELAKRIEKKKETLLALYAEEQARYNDVATEAWAVAYQRVNNYFERKRQEYAATVIDVEDMLGD